MSVTSIWNYYAKGWRITPMANEDIFKVYGHDEIAKELKEMTRGMKNKILRPALTKGAAVIRKIARNNAKVGETGHLKKSIKSKTFTAKRGAKGVVARIGILASADLTDNKPTQKRPKGTPVQLYGRAVEVKYWTINDALKQGESQAMDVFMKRAQEKMDDFHAKQAVSNKK